MSATEIKVDSKKKMMEKIMRRIMEKTMKMRRIMEKTMKMRTGYKLLKML
jgi:hypothetical protein